MDKEVVDSVKLQASCILTLLLNIMTEPGKWKILKKLGGDEANECD